MNPRTFSDSHGHLVLSSHCYSYRTTILGRPTVAYLVDISAAPFHFHNHSPVSAATSDTDLTSSALNTSSILYCLLDFKGHHLQEQ
jgi:hypothetical protein